MERRTFVGASVATLCSSAVLMAEEKREAGEFYELRMYTLKAGKQQLLDEYFSKALIPALKRLGIGPVGVFTESLENDIVHLFALIVHSSGNSAATLSARLAGDEEYSRAASAYLAATAQDPLYQRIDSSLLGAIGGMPRLEKPDLTKPRLFNLRVYESHNERAGAKKIEMFEKEELAIFRKVGLQPVFFAQTLIGAAMPNLTYMLVFPNEAARAAAWDQFRKDPQWLKLRAIPEYADKEIVSRITNRILMPTVYSEI